MPIRNFPTLVSLHRRCNEKRLSDPTLLHSFLPLVIYNVTVQNMVIFERTKSIFASTKVLSFVAVADFGDKITSRSPVRRRITSRGRRIRPPVTFENVAVADRVYKKCRRRRLRPPVTFHSVAGRRFRPPVVSPFSRGRRYRRLGLSRGRHVWPQVSCNFVAVAGFGDMTRVAVADFGFEGAVRGMPQSMICRIPNPH